MRGEPIQYVTHFSIKPNKDGFNLWLTSKDDSTVRGIALSDEVIKVIRQTISFIATDYFESTHRSSVESDISDYLFYLYTQLSDDKYNWEAMSFENLLN